MLALVFFAVAVAVVTRLATETEVAVAVAAMVSMTVRQSKLNVPHRDALFKH